MHAGGRLRNTLVQRRERVLAALAEIVDVLLVDAASAPTNPSPARYYDDATNPIAPPDRRGVQRWRAWLKRANVESFKIGNKTVARREDVEAAIEAHPLKATPAPIVANDSATDRELLQAAGVPLRRAGGRS